MDSEEHLHILKSSFEIEWDIMIDSVRRWEE